MTDNAKLSPIVGAHLERIKTSLTYFDERLARASDRRETDRKWMREGDYTFIALAGIQTDDEIVEITPGEIFVRKVQEAPGEIELAKVLKQRSLFGYVGSFMPSITHELVIKKPHGNAALQIAWAICALTRIRLQSDFMARLAANASWQTMASYEEVSVEVALLDDHSRSVQLRPPRSLTKVDASWVSTKIDRWFDHWENKAFRLSALALGTYNHTDNPNLMATILWSGLEALVSDNPETTFRLSSRLATILQNPGVGRYEAARRITKLYKLRSEIVHGGEVEKEAAFEHVREVSELLALVLQKALDVKSVWKKQDMDIALISGTTL